VKYKKETIKVIIPNNAKVEIADIKSVLKNDFIN